MWLDNWMIITIILAFGVCAVYNKKNGYRKGTIDLLVLLKKENIIKITEDDVIVEVTDE